MARQRRSSADKRRAVEDLNRIGFAGLAERHFDRVPAVAADPRLADPGEGDIAARRIA